MKNLSFMKRALVLCAVFTAAVSAQPQTDLTTPTGWLYLSNVTTSAVDTQINAGFRVVDIEIEDDAPFRVSAVLVENTGEYAKNWWWYFGLTDTEVTGLLIQNNARAIDIETYLTGGVRRFAVVMIRNTGDDAASAQGWQFGYTEAGLDAWVSSNPSNRIIDIQPYVGSGGAQRFAWCWVRNTGQQASGWWYYYGVSANFISNRLSTNNARLIDLEPQGDGSTFSCVMVPADSEPWWWFFGISDFSDIGPLLDQRGARMIDYERYSTPGGTRYAVVLRPNTNALTKSINLGMRNLTDGSSGFLMRELSGGIHASINRSFIFEPASLIKTVHHAHAMRQVAIGADTLGSGVLLDVQTTAQTGSCPIPLTPPQFPSLNSTLGQMMGASSNAHTEAIRRRYGTGSILGTAATLGMFDTDLNHTLGCLCSSPNNWLTLDDLYRLHNQVGSGFVDPFRDEFYDLMRNSLTSNPVNGTLSYQAVLDQELAASGLSMDDRDEFENLVYQATKDGSYSCTSQAAVVRHRTEGGYLRVPFRDGNCRVITREYFFGGFVFNATNGTNAVNAVNVAMTELFRDRIRDGIDSFESTVCSPCNIADLAQPYGVLDLADVTAFVSGFTGQDSISDLAPPAGVFDLSDITAFIAAFNEGCR